MQYIHKWQHNVVNYLYKDKRFVGLLNANTHPDNAYFWPREDNSLDAGLFDWTELAHVEASDALTSMLFSSATKGMIAAHDDTFLVKFLEGYRSTGANQKASEIYLEELQLRYRINSVTIVYNSLAYAEQFARSDLSVFLKNATSADFMLYQWQCLATGTFATEECMTAASSLNTLYNQIILWQRKGDLYYSAFVDWVKEEIQSHMLYEIRSGDDALR